MSTKTLPRVKTRVVFIPGNGGFEITSSNIWLSYVHKRLTDAGFNTVPLINYPDSTLARSQYWLPHIQSLMKNDDGSSDSLNTILIGHSSGCEAGMRVAETTPLYGLILVSAYHTDMGDENEKISGYFDKPWQWADIRKNVQFIDQFGSADDKFVKWDEQQFVHDQLQSTLHKHYDRGHYIEGKFDELVEVVCNRVPA